ncbi:hypothetical protein, partial [Aeromonas hydrophila]|uniref:hypothetical protein n=1 Tax=Aeromonas hydrophila TaxID=644 RepID=UPI003F661D6A
IRVVSGGFSISLLSPLIRCHVFLWLEKQGGLIMEIANFTLPSQAKYQDKSHQIQSEIPGRIHKIMIKKLRKCLLN